MSAKDLILKPIGYDEAVRFIKANHYSGKAVLNSNVHIGVFWQGRLEGAMQLGPSLDKSKLIGLVRGTKWHDFIELNRMAFTDQLPRNAESRAMAVLFRLLKKHAPQLKWIVSFADATQCGDGAIYRAVGFVLTDIKPNGNLYRLPFADVLDPAPLLAAGLSSEDVEVLRAWLRYITPKKSAPHAHKMALEGAPHAHKMALEDGNADASLLLSQVKIIMRKITGGGTSAKALFDLMGGYPAKGFQLRYIKFLDPTWAERLTVPVVPFSRIDEMDARMYRGVRARHSSSSKTSDTQSEDGGANPTMTLRI